LDLAHSASLLINESGNDIEQFETKNTEIPVMAKLKKLEERTEMFIKALEDLKKKNVIRSNSELLPILGIGSLSTITEITSRRQNIQPESWKNFKKHYDKYLGIDENNDHMLNDDGGNPVYKLTSSNIQPMQALMEIAASNRILAQAHDKQAEANRQLSEANKVLAENVSKLIENVGQQNFQAFESRFGALLELLKEVSLRANGMMDQVLLRHVIPKFGTH
jgi:hypothetical protein